MVKLNEERYFLIFEISSYVSPSNVYNFLSFIFAKENILCGFKFFSIWCGSQCLDDPGNSLWNNPQFSVLLLKCSFHILGSHVVYSIQITFNDIVSTLFLGSTHALIDCIRVISMTVWAALNLKLNLWVFFTEMLIKPVTIILFLCSLNKSQPQQNHSLHKDSDAYLCSLKSFIEISRRVESLSSLSLINGLLKQLLNPLLIL